MNVSIVPVGALEVNCVILSGDNRQAWIVDPGGDIKDILKLVREKEYTVVAIVLTHGHFDHLGGLDQLLEQLPDVPVYMAKEEAQWAFTAPENQYPPYYFLQKRPKTLQPILTDGMQLTVGALSAQIIATPGHTPAGICLLFNEGNEPLLLTGDTLFAGSIGRTDLPGGNMLTLSRSLKKLSALPIDARIIPGHGEETTLTQERATNPYLRDEDLF